MLRRRALYVARLRGWVPVTRRGWALVGLALAYLAGALLLAVSASAVADIGVALLLVVNGACMALDGRGFWTLGGRVRWSRLGRLARLGVALVFVVLVVAPLFVVWPQVHAAWSDRQRQIAERPAEIARLERQLGLSSDKPPSQLRS